MKQVFFSVVMALWALSCSAQSAVLASAESAARYELVSDASTLAAGDKIIIVCCTDGTGNYHRQALSTIQNTNNRASTAITKNTDGTISITDNTAVIELGGESEKWTFYVTNGSTTGYLCAASSSDNYLRTKPQIDKNAQAKISIGASGDATISFQGSYTHNKLLYNPTRELFSCYAAKTDNTRYPQIYRRIKALHDINRDGILSVADVTALVEILLDKDDLSPYEYDHDAADVNGDEAITIADVTALTNLLLEKVSE